jgi:ribonuclease HII
MDTINTTKKSIELQRFYDEENSKYEICIDEAGRGCLFGRVYIACVILPKDKNLFSGKDIKDSKKFSSKKKINEISNYIKSNAFAYYITFIDNEMIDKINILQSVMKGMHECIRNITENISNITNHSVHDDDCLALVDGNYFIPYMSFDEEKQSIIQMPHITIEKGDGKYMGIAAASILAKTARDEYIFQICQLHPELVTKYSLNKNMGYGTKEHLNGIQEHGITEWHRKTFGICKNY